MMATHEVTLTTPFIPSHVQLGCNGIYLALPATKSVGVWSLQSLNSKPLLLEAHKKPISCLCFGNQHNPTLLCSVAEDYIIVWNVEECRTVYDLGRQIRGQIIGQCLGDVRHCSFSLDDLLVSVCVGCDVHILDTKLERLHALLEGHTALVTCAAFSPHDASMVVSASEDRTFKIWDITKGCLVYQSCIISGFPFLSLTMNSDKENVAIGTSDGQVRVYDLTESNGFRCLHQVDIARILRVQRQSREKALSDATAKGSKTISSQPSWKAPAIDISSHDSPSSSEAGEAILGLHYTRTAAADLETTARSLPSFVPDDSLVKELLGDSSSLLIGTLGALLVLNTNSYEVTSYHDFQDPISSGPDKWHYMALSGAYTFAQKTQEIGQTWCVMGSLFNNTVDVIRISTGSTQTSLPNLHSLSLDATADKEMPVSVIATTPLSENSVLRVKSAIGSSETSTTKAGSKTTKKASGMQDQALTFKSSIKSSGYTAKPRMNMFSPKVNTSKASSAKKVKPSSGQQERNVFKEYPLSAAVPTTIKTNLSIAEKPTPINCISFSGNGQNLACAMTNKSAQVLKMPLTGKGMSLTGHNGAVNSVHWSHDSRFILTASDDRTVSLWSRLASEPLLTLKNQDRSGRVASDKLKGHSSAFRKEIKAARFYYLDQFLLLISGNTLFLYTYHIDSTVDDIKRYQCNSYYKLVRSFQLEPAQQITALSAVNGFHSYIVMCAGSDKSLEIFDMNVGRSIRTVTDVHSRPIHCICQNEGSAYASHPVESYNLFITTAVTDSIKLWDIRSNRCVKTFGGHVNRVHHCGLAVSPCARYLAAGSEDRSAYVFDVRAGTYIYKLPDHGDVVSDVAFHPLYPELVTATFEGNIRLYSDR